MGVSVGIVCNKRGFGWTVIEDGVAYDSDIEAPADRVARGEVLDWLLTEAESVLVESKATAVRIEKAGGGKFGASAERHEVEAVVQVAATRKGVDCDLLTTEGVRAAMGVPKAAGAYKNLLTRPDVKARSNEQRRHQYLLALSAGA